MLGLGFPGDSANASAAAPFGPGTLSGCTWFLIGSKGVGVADGANVPQWNDQSANGFNPSNGTGAQQPTFGATAGPNGRSCLNLSGTQALSASTSGVIAARNWSCFVVWKSTSNASVQAAVSFQGIMSPRNTSGTREVLLRGINDDLADAISNTWEAWTIQDNGSVQTLRVNGTAKTLSPNNTSPGGGTGTSVIGCLDLPPTGDQPLVGSIERVIAYNRFLSAGEVAIVEAAIRSDTLLW